MIFKEYFFIGFINKLFKFTVLLYIFNLFCKFNYYFQVLNLRFLNSNFIFQNHQYSICIIIFLLLFQHFF